MSDDRLFLDEEDRYSRLRLIAWWDQERLSTARVLVVGSGALGNEVLKNLALLGVGMVHVVDFDKIEESNLTRSVLFRHRDCGRSKAEVAVETLRDLNPDTRVVPWASNIITDIGLGLFRDVDVVIGCLDNREARLWVNRQCWKARTPWIDGGIQEINGVVKVFVPPGSACYECAMTENDYRLINLRYSCPLLRREDLLAGKVPTAPTISSIIAGMQTQEALKLIHGMDVEAGVAQVFNGVANQFYKTAFQRREDCLSHESVGEIRSLPLSATRHTAKDLFAGVRDVCGNVCGDGPWQLVLDRDLVVSLDCASCGQTSTGMKPRQLVGMDQARCASCGQQATPRLEHRIEVESPLAEETLARLGIPPYDVVRVAGDGGEGFFLLDGDRELVWGSVA